MSQLLEIGKLLNCFLAICAFPWICLCGLVFPSFRTHAYRSALSFFLFFSRAHCTAPPHLTSLLLFPVWGGVCVWRREMSSTAIFKNGGNGAYGLTDSLSSKTIDALGVIYDDCSKAATSASQLGREFEELWPGIVNDLVKKTLNDMENEEAFMDRCLWYI